MAASNKVAQRTSEQPRNTYCRKRELVACVRKPREKIMSKAMPTPPKLEKRTPKVGGFAANFVCGFFEFWRGGSRFLIVLPEILARRPLIPSYDNTYTWVFFENVVAF